MTTKPRSYYVRRNKETTPGGFAYVGPIRSGRQAKREQDAWNGSDSKYGAIVLPSTPEVKTAVRAWMKAVRARRAA